MATQAQKNLYKAFSDNPLLWGMYYFPHHFRSKSPPFHLKIIQECLKNRYLAMQCPRESAKSTLINFLYSAHNINFKKKRFIVLVQNTFSKAATSLDTIKTEYKTNAKLMEDYQVEIKKDLTGDSILRHPDGFETRILCKGAEQIGSVRGEKFGAWRPDLIIIDDLEDDVMVRNPDQREFLRRLYDDALIPAGDQELCQVIAIGTILHDDSLMAKLVSLDHYKEYRKLFYIALYANQETKKLFSLWDEKWTVEKLLHMRKTKPDVFAKEYQGDPASGGRKQFNKEDFRYWQVQEDHYVLFGKEGHVVSKGALSDCKCAIGCDLAWEEKKTSDDTVLMPLLITPNADLLVDEYFNDKGVKPDQLEGLLFAMVLKYEKMTGKPVEVGFEKGKIEKINKWFLKQAMRRRNKFLSIKDIPWVHDKIGRIVTPLQPRYKQHTIYHKSGMEELEFQLTRIPSGTHDDLPDALQMGCRMLEYAPTKRVDVEIDEDEGFEWLRQQVVNRNKKHKSGKRYIFGKKTQSLRSLPAKETWR